MPALNDSSPLLQPIKLGTIDARNRVLMAPLTRSRAADDGSPTDLQTQYYRQRAGAGLIIAEGTQPSAGGKGYVRTPGLHTDAHQAAWARIADAVHEEGGSIVVQLMHTGRMSHPDNSGLQGVAPSAIAPQVEIFTRAGMQPVPVPRALEPEEIPALVEEFVRASRRAVDAGLDGVELHAANGYVLHQFLSDGANRRTDRYGGPAAHRARLVIETVAAVADEIGADRLGIRISPGHEANDAAESDAWGPYSALVDDIGDLGLAYLHVLIHPDDPVLPRLRAAWTGNLVLNTGFGHDTTRDELEAIIEHGTADAVAVGRPFIANPDLVRRWTVGAELNEPDPATFYGGDERGYLDYPSLEA